ncbi:MAG TPA: Tad domain-containing protein [Candidatus Angelobacter sp.]|nr:Tad domain-containing protein [Candidatus Angelobacter sp.]
MRFIAPSTATKSPQRRLQEGQAIVLIALLMLVLFAMLGLAIDSGRAYVDRRDLQTAVDAAALAAGDWYENYSDLTGTTGYGALPHGSQIFETDLHLYSGGAAGLPVVTLVGTPAVLTQTTYSITYTNLTLSIQATNTQFNGYQFVFSAVHQLPLAFMQIFGGPTTATITATATSIVGNQRQSPALLTLSTGACATNLSGAGQLTVLGDTYSNGTVCTGGSLHEAGNCYGAAGSQCSSATYYCYNATPGFIPYDPNGTPPPGPPHAPGACALGDVIGGPVVPAPSLPDPGYLAPSVPSYSAAGVMIGHGSYTELTPGVYGGLFTNAGTGCMFLDAGVYTWNGTYSSHGGMVSNELKSPDEELYSAPGTTSMVPAVNNFWGAGGCAGKFTVTAASVPGGQGLQHQGGLGNWGIEVTSARYDRFLDPTITPNPCFSAPGCWRESAPSACHEVSTIDLSNQGVNVNITVNAPGAQYYNVYINPQGCIGDLGYLSPSRNDFSFVNTFSAPAAGATLVGGLAPGGWACAAPGVSVCNIGYNSLLPATTHVCSSWLRANKNCWAPDDETVPTCFASCPPQPAVPQENAAFTLQYNPNTSGDVANENYCQAALTSGGDPNQPCATAKITPGAVQFYQPAGQCMDQNGGGYTHVFSGEQYNWIIIYQAPGPTPIPPNPITCNPNKLNGNALTQYIGTIYSPTSDWQIQGADKSPLSGQVICFSATVTGAGQAGIDYNPNYAPAPPAARLIN